jgi:hypothetical protein
MILPVIDLSRSRQDCDPASVSIARANDVRRQAGVCTGYGASAAPHLSQNRDPLREWKVKSFSRLDQFLSMAFAQLTFQESLCDIPSTSYDREVLSPTHVMLAGSTEC